jgi:two-component system, chemotaxis family, chemotaxis protein CheY
LPLRLRITFPLSGTVDGVDLSRFTEGLTYEVGTTIGNYLLAEGWAVISSDSQPPRVPLRHTLRRPDVLIVEDDEDMRTVLAHWLALSGWEPHLAADGIEGLHALERLHPSVILLDLAMPRMDGVQFREAQRRLANRQLASVPVVVVSARIDALDFQQRLGASDVLVKPFEAERLLAAVQTCARPAGLFRSD